MSRSLDSQMRKIRGRFTVAAAIAPLLFTVQSAEAAKIGIVLETFGNPAQACVRDAATAEAAKHEGTEVQVLAGTSGADVTVMVRLIEDLVQSKVDVVAFMASDAEVMAGVAKKIEAEGTPVLIHLDDTKEQVARHFIGPNQEAGEAAMAKILAEAIGGTGKVAVLEGQPGNMSSEVRKKGATEMFAQYPNIEMVGVWNGGWDRALGLKVTEDILTAHPDLKAIAAVNDEMAFGALQAVKARGLESQVLITGFNGTTEAIKAVEAGTLQGTVLTFCASVGSQIVKTALDVLAGTDPKEYLVDTGAVALDTKLVKAISDALATK